MKKIRIRKYHNIISIYIKNEIRNYERELKKREMNITLQPEHLHLSIFIIVNEYITVSEVLFLCSTTLMYISYMNKAF